MNEIIAIIQFVGRNVWSVWPLFLISIGLSVLVRALKLDGMIRRAFNANVTTSILLATFVGAFSPFCSCTVIPIIAGLLISGVPLAPIMSFWIASPTMDPEIFTLSVGILGWPMALARLGATLVVSLSAGYITLALTNTSLLNNILPTKRKQREAASPIITGPVPAYSMAMATDSIPVSPPVISVSQVEVCDTGSCSTAAPDACSSTGCSTSSAPPSSWRSQLTNSFQEINWPQFGREVVEQSWALGRWLLLAFVMEALITTYVPQDAIASMLGGDSFFAVPLAALIGIPLYLNNFSALPIVSGLLAQGMQSGAAIAFLIAGPVTTVPAMTAVYGVVHKRIFALYLSVSLLGAVLMGIITNFLLG